MNSWAIGGILSVLLAIVAFLHCSPGLNQYCLIGVGAIFTSLVYFWLARQW